MLTVIYWLQSSALCYWGSCILPADATDTHPSLLFIYILQTSQ